MFTAIVSLVGLFSDLSLAQTQNDQAINNEAPASPISTLESNNLEIAPVAFRSSYVGGSVNQNFALFENANGFSKPKVSWGLEYRFFYKDEWTLAICGEFKGQPDQDQRERSIFSISQETMKIFRLYHPWYISVGGRISYQIPVKKISIPYERDQDRNLYPGGGVTIATIYKPNDRLLLLISAQRWASLSTQTDQGFTGVISALFPIR